MHKTCTTRYDSHKLQRFKSSTETSADSSTCETSRSLRSNGSAKSITGKIFFCSQTAKDNLLHQLQTLHIDVCVRKITHKLVDTILLAKVSERDMVAVGAMYHSNCRKKLYNKCRIHNNRKSSDIKDFGMIQGKFTRKRHASFPDIKTN